MELEKKSRSSLARGNKILFWEDKWIPTAKDFKIHTARPPDCPLEYAHEFIDQNTRPWKEEEVRRWVPKETADSIISLPISHSGQDDSLVWHYTSKGSYSVKTGYHLAYESQKKLSSSKASSSFQPPQAIWKFIWSMNVPPKLKYFWWKACCIFLVTKENLHKRKCQTSPICSICNKEPESVEHLLFRCKWTAASWFGSDLNCLVEPESIPSVMKWTISLMENLNPATDSHETVSKCIFLAWQIWKSRNG